MSMRCVICKKGRAEGRTLYRINAGGVPGLWACREHLDQTDAPKPDPVVEEIISAIEHSPRWNQPSAMSSKEQTTWLIKRLRAISYRDPFGEVLRSSEQADIERAADLLEGGLSANAESMPTGEKQTGPIREAGVSEAHLVARRLTRELASKPGADVARGEQVRSEASEPPSSEGGEEK